MIYYNSRIPTVKLKIPGKSIFGLRNQNFCYIQVIVFDLSYLPVDIKRCFPQFFMVAKSQPLPLVTEVLVSDFKNAFSRNFQLHRRDPSYGLQSDQNKFSLI